MCLIVRIWLWLIAWHLDAGTRRRGCFVFTSIGLLVNKRLYDSLDDMWMAVLKNSLTSFEILQEIPRPRVPL